MKKLFSIVAVIAIVGILAGASFGSAADLRVQGGTIQAGADYDVKLYDLAEVAGWGLETDTGLVSFVRLVLAGCPEPGGNNEITVFVNITDVNHCVIAQGSYHIDFPYGNANIPNVYGPFTVNFDHPVPACEIYDIHVFIEGSANSGPTTPVCPTFPTCTPTNNSV